LGAPNDRDQLDVRADRALQGHLAETGIPLREAKPGRPM
jgi:hypothetical protein